MNATAQIFYVSFNCEEDRHFACGATWCECVCHDRTPKMFYMEHSR